MSAADSTTNSAREAATLLAVLSAAVSLPFGQALTGVQLPAITASFHATPGGAQWVANAYNLAFTAFLLVSGALADRLGRRSVYIAGTAVFLSGSLASALAPSLALLNICRFVAGAGAAAQLASAPALLATAFPEPGAKRARAFGLLGTGFGIGLALGPVAGGWLISTFGWRVAFAIVVPFAIVGIMAAATVGDGRSASSGRFDTLGSLCFALALTAFMIGLTGIADHHHVGIANLLWLCAAAALIGLWVAIERRVAAPMFDLTAFGDAAFLGASVAWYAAAFGFVALLIFVPVALQANAGTDAFAAGVAMLPMTIPLLIVPSLAPRLVARAGARNVVAVGLGLVAAGDALAAMMPGRLAVGLALVGVGAGAVNGLLDNIAMSTIPSERAGMAAGGFQTMRVSGDAIAIGAAGAIYASVAGPDAFSALLAVLAVLTAAAGLVAVRLLRGVDRTQPDAKGPTR